MSKRRIHFIINPIAGVKRKVKVVDELKRYLKPEFRYGIDFTEHAAHATELTKEAVLQGAEAVIAVGGDGTINEVAKALVGSEVNLGVIPMGSGNGFARHMEIPLKAQEAIACINRFRIQRIDTGLANDDIFLSTVGLGFDALVGKKFADFGKRGLWSYMQISTTEFFKFEAEAYHLMVDGKEIQTKAFLINFANVGQYGNNAWIAPNASVNDGLLDVCILEEFPHAMVGDIIFKLFNKHLDQSKYYQSMKAKEIVVLTPSLYHLDGEPRERSTLKVKIVPNSLNVIV
jgi:YegS/Rv2252/BmrU family lipid kinase